jgi:glyoxylase-like metal-dependent hydrolase (beta-lactamase superfamily II)
VHVPSKTRKKVEWFFRRAEGALLSDGLLAAEGAHLDPKTARARIEAMPDEIAQLHLEARAQQLWRAMAGDVRARTAYVDQHGACGARKFHAGERTNIYQIAVETFPRHVNNVYLLIEPGSAVMLDCGSGIPSSRRDLALGFAIVREVWGEDVRHESLDWCVISHAHIDHFGGANLLKEQSRARLAVHALDARVLECFDERLIMASKDLDVFWRRSGVPDDARTTMLDAYASNKSFFRPMEVDRVLADGDTIGPGYRVVHVPGHCPGLICLRVHDVLLTSDHVLSRITPHQFPQAVTPWGGLAHYFLSLEKVRRLEGINFALGGHEEPIWDLRARVDAIEAFHKERLAKVLGICKEPRTVQDVADALFGQQDGYGPILALDEAGAHVEYLYVLGKLRVFNLDEVAATRDPVVRYVARAPTMT